MAENYGREFFEARMVKLNCTANLRRYVTEPREYRSKTVEAAWQTWVEAWQRATYGMRDFANEGRRIAYTQGLKDGAAASLSDAEGAK